MMIKNITSKNKKISIKGSLFSLVSLNIMADMLVAILKERRIKVKAMVFHPGGS